MTTSTNPKGTTKRSQRIALAVVVAAELMIQPNQKGKKSAQRQGTHARRRWTKNTHTETHTHKEATQPIRLFRLTKTTTTTTRTRRQDVLRTRPRLGRTFNRKHARKETHTHTQNGDDADRSSFQP